MTKEKDLFVGIDIGSSALNLVVLDEDKRVIHSSEPIMHFANPLGALREAWEKVTRKFPRSRIKSTVFTGSVAKTFPRAMKGLPYIADSVAIPKGVGLVNPEAKYVFHIGAKDTYFFDIGQAGGKKIIQEWKAGTKCGGGSGTLLEKQCTRLFSHEFPLSIKDTSKGRNESERERIRRNNRKGLQDHFYQMFEKAEQEARISINPSEFLARCGVVIQSDLIHKQNEGATRPDNIAGLFRTVARNYVTDVLGVRDFSKGEAVATGGVFSNEIILRDLGDFLGKPVKRSRQYSNIAAVGAALNGIEEKHGFVFDASYLEKITGQSREERKSAPSLSSYLPRVHERDETLETHIEKGTEVILGIDGGSTTTKGILIDLKTGRLLDKLYIPTHGNPEASLKEVIRYLAKHRNNIVVMGVGATGSARGLYKKILMSKRKVDELKKAGKELADRVTDEITCHAIGVRYHNPEVDTIFEIGGQDMKFTTFSGDSVREAKMNYSCQAGSGQTLENMARAIDLDVKGQLQEAALRAEKVPVIDSTCGVFMEMDLNRLIASGFSKDEMAAAIVLGTAASYVHKFVGGSKVGKKCSAQGGPALGKAFLAALAQVTGKEIEAYPHREIFGAFGQALDIQNSILKMKEISQEYGTAFRGWDLVDMEFKKTKTNCRTLYKDKSCGKRDCSLEVISIGDEDIVSGGFCPRGNSDVAAKPTKDYSEVYHQIYNAHFKKRGKLLEELRENEGRKVVGIRRASSTLGEKGIWSAALLKELGFLPVVTPPTNGEIAKRGVDNSRPESCYARKIVTGHAAILIDNPKIDFLFNPSFVTHLQKKKPDLRYCVYTASEPYILNDVLSIPRDEQISPVLCFGNEKLLASQIKKEFRRLGYRFSNERIKKALEAANSAEQEFRTDLYKEGDKFLERVEKKQEVGYVVLGRDYVVLDPEASSQAVSMFSRTRGLNCIPQVFLAHKFSGISLEGIVQNEYWAESRGIVQAGLYVASHPNLFPIRLMNFNCGPDSLKIYQEKAIQESVDKPMLELVTDAQTNNAPFVTRTEAHERVVNQSKPQKISLGTLIETLKTKEQGNVAGRTWLIPYMGDASFVGAATLRHFGINAEVLPTNTEGGYGIARQYLSTEVCYPLKGVVGDVLDFLRIKSRQGEDVRKKYLVMLPTTSGPCRFGKYTEVVRDFMKAEGFESVPVTGPTSETDYFNVPLPGNNPKSRIELQKILVKGVIASDLLEDITLRFRPYANDPNQVDNLKRKRLDKLVKIIESGASDSGLIRWSQATVKEFEKLPASGERHPVVLYTGEIYMRQHDPYTHNVIKRLEENGLEVVRSPVMEWINYINGLKLAEAFENKDFSFFKSFLKYGYTWLAERRIGESFEHALKGRHVFPHPTKMIKRLEREGEYHRTVRGESPIGIGTAYYFMNDLIENHGEPYISGIFHIGPFTCMQEGVATAKIEAMAKELRKKRPDLVFPVVHCFIGDSANPNLDSEIAVFREQCYQKRDMAGRSKKQWGTIP